MQNTNAYVAIEEHEEIHQTGIEGAFFASCTPRWQTPWRFFSAGGKFTFSALSGVANWVNQKRHLEIMRSISNSRSMEPFGPGWRV
jgi:hypothetical protein